MRIGYYAWNVEASGKADRKGVQKMMFPFNTIFDRGTVRKRPKFFQIH